jgi:hypothetical protein
MSRCNFDNAWAGLCNAPVVEGSDKCAEHKDLKCDSCGKSAVRSCDHTGQFVCGYPLCAECTHGIPQDGKFGIFGCGGGHFSKEVVREQTKAAYGR